MNRAALLTAVSSSMGARVATAALNYALFWRLSHALGKEALGGFSLLMNIYLMAQTLPLLGLSIPLWRRAAAAPRRLRGELSNAVAFGLPVGALMGLGIGGFGQWSYGAPLAISFWLVGFAMLPTTWTLVAECALFGLERVADVARVNFVESLARAVLTVLVVRTGAGLTGVFIVFLGLRIGAAVWYFVHPAMPRPRLRLLSRAVLRRNVAEVPVFSGIVLLAAMASRIDLVVLAHLRGLADAATYSAASRLYDATLMVPTITALVLMPTLARQFTADRNAFCSTLDIAVRVSLFVGVGVALAVAALAQPVIDLLYRPQMHGAAPVLRWLIFASVLMLVDTVLSSTMIAAKAQLDDLRSLGVAFLVLVAGLFSLPLGFGPAGAAAAVVLAMSVRVAWRLRWAASHLGLRPWPGLARLALSASAGVAALLLGLRVSAWAALLAGPAAYGLAVLLSGVWGRHPWQRLRIDIARLSGRQALGSPG